MSRSGIMLAYPFEEKRFEKWGNKGILQPKLDGERCRAIIDDVGNVTLLSSEKNVIDSVPHITKALTCMVRNIELDGELYVHGEPFSEIHSIVSRKVQLRHDYDKMQYHIFDIIKDGTQAERLIELQALKPTLERSGCIKVVPNYFIEGFTNLMSYYDTLIGANYEGFIIRHPGALYTRRRSVYMMKFKPRKEDYYTIVGYQEEVSIHGEKKCSLGALVCKDDMGTLFNVGTGPALTREARVQLWYRRNELLGKVARVKYQHLTEKKVPRFPVLVEVIDPINNTTSL